MTDNEHPGRDIGAPPPLTPVDLTKRPQPPGSLAGFAVSLHKPGTPEPPPPLAGPTLNLTKPATVPRPAPAVPDRASWQPGPAAPAGSSGRSAVVVGAVVVLAIVATALATYALTRPDSVPDGLAGGGGTGRSGGSATAITPCPSPPQVGVQSVEMAGSGLRVTADLSSPCSGGDVLIDPQLEIALSDGNRDVAAGVFDTGSDPVVIPPGGTTSREFVFASGSYWQTPETVGAQGSGLDVTARRSRPAGSSAITVDDGSSTLTAIGVAAPVNGSADGAALDGLRALAAADKPVIASSLANRWVPQISSKQPGLVAEGLTWTASDILREHLDLRQRYPEVRLVWSGDWRTFNTPDWWVTIVGAPSNDASRALSWCVTNGFDADHCYAKIVSATMGREGTTVLRK